MDHGALVQKELNRAQNGDRKWLAGQLNVTVRYVSQIINTEKLTLKKIEDIYRVMKVPEFAVILYPGRISNPHLQGVFIDLAGQIDGRNDATDALQQLSDSNMLANPRGPAALRRLIEIYGGLLDDEPNEE